MRARSSRGFTLVEIIVMIVIIAIMLAVAIPNFSGAQDRSRNSGVQHNVHLVQQALEEYGSEVSHQYADKLSTEFLGKGNDYLPGDSYPPTPWNKQQAPTTDLPFDEAKNGFVYQTVEGKIEDPVSTSSYGAISWGIGPDGKGTGRSQQYVLAGTGKKGKNPMRVLTVRNF